MHKKREAKVTSLLYKWQIKWPNFMPLNLKVIVGKDALCVPFDVNVRIELGYKTFISLLPLFAPSSFEFCLYVISWVSR